MHTRLGATGPLYARFQELSAAIETDLENYLEADFQKADEMRRRNYARCAEFDQIAEALAMLPIHDIGEARCRVDMMLLYCQVTVPDEQRDSCPVVTALLGLRAFLDRK